MKIKLLLLTLAVAILAPAAIAQSVVVTGKKTTYKRISPMSDEKKTFAVNHPKVKAATPALSKKIEAAIGFERVIPIDIKEEINEVQWLEEADFQVGYNKNGLLIVNLSVSGSGAYPSTTNKTVAVDTRTGNRVGAGDLFVNLNGLAAMIKRAQRKEIAEAIAEIKEMPENDEPNPEQHFSEIDFRAADIKEFSIDDKGVTFHYDYEFPHVIQALQPPGRYFYTYAQLRPYIKRDGLLARIAR